MEMQSEDEQLPTKIHEIVGEEEGEASKEENQNVSMPKRTPSRYVQKYHPKTQIVGDKEAII